MKKLDYQWWWNIEVLLLKVVKNYLLVTMGVRISQKVGLTT